MFKNRIMKKLGAGLIAGLCAFSMLGATAGGLTAYAADSATENPAFPTSDKVVAQAATLLGCKYLFGYKGYTGVYYQGSYKPMTEAAVRKQGIDCSGLVYYTLTHLGYQTGGFSWNNPVPVDNAHWLTISDKCTVTYGGVTSKIDLEKKNISSKDRPYWECADGSTIAPGSVVVADNPDGVDHAWIYIGEFASRAEIVNYLKNIGVNESLITDKTVGDGNGDGGTHWRIESNGSEGVVINNKTDGKKATAMNMYAFRVTKTNAKFGIKKVYFGDHSVVINGTSPIDSTKAIYGVYSDKACTVKVGEITIGSDGIGSIDLPDKTYYVKEIAAPTGYSLSNDVFQLKANDTVLVTEDYLKGSIRIDKTAEDGMTEGREFKVTWTEKNRSHELTAKTDANGIAAFNGLNVYDLITLKPITYNVSEINVDTRYESPKAQDITLVNGNADLTVTANFSNVLKKGNIQINKQSEDGQNGDRTFRIVGGGKTYDIVTNADGIAMLTDIPVYDSKNEKITYTISENNVPIKYVIPANQTVTLTADETTNVTFKNILKKFSLEVTKKDAETSTPQGDASLAGAVYGLYKNGKLLKSFTTDENGCFTTDEYVCGEYVLKEISASKGYLLDETEYAVGNDAEHYVIESNVVPMDVTESVIKGKIAIIKHSDDNPDVIQHFECGAEFEVYLKSAGSYESATESERDILVTDENGYAESKSLPYGVYTVHQTVTIDDAAFAEDFDVTVSANDQIYEYVINNAPFKSYVKLVKVDAETGNAIAYATAGFALYDADGNRISVTVGDETIDTFFTENNGILMTPMPLRYGDYTLYEVQAPMGYVLSEDGIVFHVSSENSEQEDAVTVIKLTKANSPQKGRISVQQTGNIFRSVTALGSAISVDEDGTVHTYGENIYHPVFENGGLAGAEFEVIAAEDIVTADGTIRAKNGDVVATLVTNENGYAETDLLYLGKYTVQETNAPYGYVRNATPQTAELAYAGQKIEVRDTVNTAFDNEYQKVQILLTKEMECDELFGIGRNDEYRMVRFGLYADETLTAADGSVIPQDGLLAEVSLDENHSAIFEENLPLGRYYVKEIATDEHYMLNGEKYPVNFEYMGQEMTTVQIDCGTFTNRLKRSNANGRKVSESGEPLENALFGLFDMNALVFTEDTAMMTAVSDATGCFTFSDIPYGSYLVREIQAPVGYILSDEIYPVTIDEDGDTVEILAENKAITVEFSKETIYGEELAGAKMQLIDENEIVVDEWISDTETHIIAELAAGSYILKEVASPDGYVIATDIRFTVDEYGKVSVEGVDAEAFSENGNPLIVMVDNTTLVKVSKRDITNDAELPGATLQIIDENGEIVEEWVSTTEPHYIEGKLIAGKTYTLKEIIAPDGYEIANAIEFTVSTDGTVDEVVMRDELTPEETKTGDTGRNPLGYLLLFVGICFTVFGAVIGRKEDENEKD